MRIPMSIFSRIAITYYIIHTMCVSAFKKPGKIKINVDLYTYYFVLYSIMKGIKNMNYIKLESVGSLVTNEGNVFPIDCSEAPETASDADEMMGVHILDTDTEWWENMSMEDANSLFPFLAEIPDVYYSGNYLTWAVRMYEIVERANGEYVEYEDSWHYSNTLGVS